jgi:hypothetical protein
MAGRVLSRANESKLRNALSALSEVLALLDVDVESMDDVEAEEAAIGAEFVPLVEGTLRRDGTVPVKLIQPGWGSSGFYPAEVLERDGPIVFPAKTKMYWNHPTLSEEAERPEGDLRNLAAELVSGARWEATGVAGPGLYADAKVFGPYQAAVEELAPHIGVSIRAAGRAVAGEAEGRQGRIVQQLVNARSVDFVTEPGAGGQIISMFEAARRGGGRGAGGEEASVPSNDNGELQFQEESEMSEELQAQLTEAQRQIEALQAANGRLAEGLVLRDARALATDVLAEANLPEVTRRRLLGQVATNPPIGEDGQLDALVLRQRVTEAITAEQQYLAEAAGYGAGRIQNVGGQPAQGGQVDEAAVQARMAEAFQSLGLSETSAKAAANGR